MFQQKKLTAIRPITLLHKKMRPGELMRFGRSKHFSGLNGPLGRRGSPNLTEKTKTVDFDF